MYAYRIYFKHSGGFAYQSETKYSTKENALNALKSVLEKVDFEKVKKYIYSIVEYDDSYDGFTTEDNELFVRYGFNP